jgi:flagellar biosynthesis/type III secretory pathway protein FliH
MNAVEQVQALYEAWEKRTLRKGLKQGLESGLKQGREEALREVLVGQLTQRFGSLPRAASERIQQADAATLERWVGRVLPAASLDDVLA